MTPGVGAKNLLTLLKHLQYVTAFIATKRSPSSAFCLWKQHLTRIPISYYYSRHNIRHNLNKSGVSSSIFSIEQKMANTRRSTRSATMTMAISKSASSNNDKIETEKDEEIEKEPIRKKEKSPATKKRKSTKKEATSSVSSSEVEDDGKIIKKTTKKTNKVEPQIITVRDPPQLPKLWDAEKNPSSYTFTIISWNVAGLRAVLRNHPEALSNLARMYSADVLCLQETKLQEKHLDDLKLDIRATLQNEGYDGYYNCATSKLGYSGTAVFIKRYSSSESATTIKAVLEKSNVSKKQTKLGQFFSTKENDKKSRKVKSGNSSDDQKDETADDDKKVLSFNVDESYVHDLTPKNLEYTINNNLHDTEGRTITVQYPLFTLVNVYVPNSGAKLERLDYRTKKWDTDFLSYMQEKQKTSKKQHPVICLGDLNVAHKSQDVWNDGAKHLAKQAGTTPEERQSFSNQLSSGGFIDAFRQLHPDALGYYSYWSQRAKNRPANKGLRLDYFICSEDLFEDEERVCVKDSFMIHDFIGSDHCPVVLQLEIKKK